MGPMPANSPKNRPSLYRNRWVRLASRIDVLDAHLCVRIWRCHPQREAPPLQWADEADADRLPDLSRLQNLTHEFAPVSADLRHTHAPVGQVAVRGRGVLKQNVDLPYAALVGRLRGADDADIGFDAGQRNGNE